MESLTSDVTSQMILPEYRTSPYPVLSYAMSPAFFCVYEHMHDQRYINLSHNSQHDQHVHEMPRRILLEHARDQPLFHLQHFHDTFHDAQTLLRAFLSLVEQRASCAECGIGLIYVVLWVLCGWLLTWYCGHNVGGYCGG